MTETLTAGSCPDTAEHLNDRLQQVASALQRWTRLRKKDVPVERWSFPPVVSLVTKLDWDVLLLGHAVASRGRGAVEMDGLEIERRLAEVETTIAALDGMLSGHSPAGPEYGYAI